MKYTLYEYQEKAVKNLIKHSEKLFDSVEKDKYILLKAITGAGKTIIAGSYIEEMFNKYSNLAFVWISVGKGGLHEQSKNSLKEKLSSSISVKLTNEALRYDYLSHKDILVLNWEGLNTTKIDEITGEKVFENISMRDGEKRNLQQLWANTKNNGTKIVLIIDESHNTAKSQTSKDIINLISPEFVLEITATPNKERIPNGIDIVNNRAFYEEARTSDVIKTGIIKKSIVLNDIVEDNDDFDCSVEFMINNAIAKRNELIEAYKLEKENINPLCIIQLPDGQSGNILKHEVVSILEKKGYSVSDKNLAIWINNEHLNTEALTDNHSPIDFLIFKQAIATGWDCPRASILVKLRDTKSTTFDLQTIGRILRMPNRTHYSNECLNNGYIYTNSEYTINTGDYDKVLPVRQALRNDIQDEVLTLIFNSEKIGIGNELIDIKTIEDVFISKINKHPLKFRLDSLTLNIRTGETNVTDFDKTANSEVAITISDEKLINLTDKDIDNEFTKYIKEITNKHYPSKDISNIIKRYFNTIPELNGDYLKIKKTVLVNKETITQYFNEMKNELKKSIPTCIDNVTFSFKKERYTVDKETIFYPKCAYYNHFVSKYETEKTFEKYLENFDNVRFWIKNVDSGDGLSVVYDYEEVKHEFYPDYIVKFSNGDIGIYEVKEINDKEKTTISNAKMNRLNQYAFDNGYKFGKIEIEKNKVYQPTLPLELK